jgi:cobalamin biosynthesis protein CobD/CbiB
MGIGLSVAAIILVIGLVRVLLVPYTGFINFIMEILLIDLLIGIVYLSKKYKKRHNQFTRTKSSDTRVFVEEYVKLY